MSYSSAHLSSPFVGTLIDMILLGVLVMQGYIYVERFWQKDEAWLKVMVFFLLISDMVHAVFDVVFLYHYVVTHFGNYTIILFSSWKLNSGDHVMTVIISCICQTFFAWRVKQLSHSNGLFISLLILILVQSLMGAAITIVITILKAPDVAQNLRIPMITWFSFSSIIDIVLTVILIWYSTSQKPVYGRINTILWKVEILAIQSGLIIAIWVSINLILYSIFSNSLHLIFNLPLGNIYTTSLMSVLNSRDQCKYETENDTRLPLQKVDTTLGVSGSNVRMPNRPQRVIWAAKGDVVSNQPSGYLQFGLDVPPESGILVTSSTIVHRDRGKDEGEDGSDVQVSEDPYSVVHYDFINPSSSRLTHPPIRSTTGD